jgi:hypothetical protein
MIKISSVCLVLHLHIISGKPLPEDETTHVFYLNTWHEVAIETIAAFDLLGDCYLSFKTIGIGYDVIDQCRFECAHMNDTDTWTPIEKLKPSTFEVDQASGVFSMIMPYQNYTRKHCCCWFYYYTILLSCDMVWSCICQAHPQRPHRFRKNRHIARTTVCDLTHLSL